MSKLNQSSEKLDKIDLKLTAEDIRKLLTTLEKRFLKRNKPYKTRVEGLTWDEVQSVLIANPNKLWSLNEMELSGGEPDLVSYDSKKNEYLFIDCSKETPEGRTDCFYDKAHRNSLKNDWRYKPWIALKNPTAIDMAAAMGIEILTKTEYREVQTKGAVFDHNTGSYIKISKKQREDNWGDPEIGGQDEGNTIVVRFHTMDLSYVGFRGSLRIYGNKESISSDKTTLTKIAANTKESVNNIISRGLSLEKATELVGILRKRFEKRFLKENTEIKWDDVQKALEKSPEKLWSLNEMERTGGEPCLFEFDKKKGEYVFFDCSLRRPSGRTRLAYDKKAELDTKKNFPEVKCNGNAIDMAENMGVDLMSASEYLMLQKKGILSINKGTFASDPYWLTTSTSLRKEDKFKACFLSTTDSQDREVPVHIFSHENYLDDGELCSFRASVRVHKIDIDKRKQSSSDIK